MNEFLEQFVIEARELVEQGTADLLALERSPSDRGNLDGAFRAFHTLKGGAGIVDFDAMSRAMHAAEDVLTAVRSGRKNLTTAVISDCLGCLDQVVRWLDAVQDSDGLPLDADAEADAVVQRFAAGEAREAQIPAVSPRAAPREARVLEDQFPLLTAEGEGSAGRWASAGRVAVAILRHSRRDDLADEVAGALAEAIERNDPSGLAEAMRAAVRGLAAPAPESPTAAVARVDPLSRTLRINADRVNALVDLTGELTVAKNAVAHLARRARDERAPLATELKLEHARLDRLIAALQAAVLELRVLPVRAVFQRFSRVVRELSESLGKPARLIIEGEDTEVDKAIIEMLFEPLLHVIRNAIDHGIETAPERAAAAKPAFATLSLRAHRQGDHVAIEIEDDGRGVNVDRVRASAVERGLASAQEISAMSEGEIVDLIFAPGFSTAARVTDVSGRGVGMDAVRAAVERIGGRVAIETRPGVGTTITFVLPFSVMLTRVLTVRAGGQTFGVPIEAIVETALLRRDNILAVGHERAFVFRAKTVPVVELSRLLRRSGEAPAGPATIVVASSAGRLWGLEVDGLGERMDVIMRPPDGLLAGTPEIAGTSMLGDGTVLLVLDLMELLG